MYSADLVPISQLDRATRQRMQELYFEVYEGSTPAIFQADLDAKHEALLLRHSDHGHAPVGFTTLHHSTQPWQNATVQVVYSGDTVVHPQHWGQQTLAFSFVRRLGQLHRQAPEQPVIWLLLTKGPRTFHYLSAFTRSFWPCWHTDRSDLRPLADLLAAERFGSAYDPESGLVRWSESRGQLKAEWAAITPEEAGRPGTRFFLQKNPHYARGDELVCLCEIAPHNMPPLTCRLFASEPE